MIIAITGNKGFIGSHLQPLLEKEGHEIIEIDISLGKDITHWGSIEDIPAFDIMIHLAAKIFVPDSFNFPHEFHQTNVTGTFNVLELCRRRGAKMIFFSSYLYGNPLYLPIDEQHPLAPHNPYAQSKLICEKLCEGYHRDFQVPVIVFRPFNIYGIGQNSSFLIPKIIEQISNGIIKLSDPRPRRDFIHINDIVNAVLNAINLNILGFEIFNLGSGKSISIDELICVINGIHPSPIEVQYSYQERKGEVLDTVADITKATTLLHWKPEIEIMEGLKSIMNA